MTDNEEAPADAKEITELPSIEIDEDQEFLERLWSFGEGYFDFSIIEEMS